MVVGIEPVLPMWGSDEALPLAWKGANRQKPVYFALGFDLTLSGYPSIPLPLLPAF